MCVYMYMYMYVCIELIMLIQKGKDGAFKDLQVITILVCMYVCVYVYVYACVSVSPKDGVFNNLQVI